MAWLKKNLLLAVGGAVALVLLGVAVFFLWSQYRREAEVTAALNDQSQQLEGFARKEPNPGNEKVDNIKAAKEQDKLLREFEAEARKTFVPQNYPTNLESGQLKLLMDTTIDELTRAAARSGVKLPDDFGFTFGTLRRQMSFDSGNIQPLARMLTDIRGVCLSLFQARILALDGIRRCTVVPTLDTPGPEFWNKKPTTNEYAAIIPYEFTFHCFTTELGQALENLYRSPQAYLVKNIVVDTSQSTLLEKPAEGADPTMPAGPMMNFQQMQMMMRYGMRGGRYGGYMPPPQPVPAPTTTSGGLSPMLDEKPFRAILWIETLRLLDPSEAKAVRARPTRPAAPVGETTDGSTPAPDASATPADPAAPSPDAPAP